MWQRLVELPCLVDFDVRQGRSDRGNAFERASLLKEYDPERDLHIVDHCKHLVQWDASDGFHKLAARFLPN
jgi:pimeloyl-ACP methyl ester carboxylesterase